MSLLSSVREWWRRRKKINSILSIMDATPGVTIQIQPQPPQDGNIHTTLGENDTIQETLNQPAPMLPSPGFICSPIDHVTYAFVIDENTTVRITGKNLKDMFREKEIDTNKPSVGNRYKWSEKA